MAIFDLDKIKSNKSAAADYSAQARYSLLKDHSTAGQLIVATAKTDDPCGVLWNSPDSGDGIEWMPLVNGEEVPVIVSGNLALGNEVCATTAGKVQLNDATAGNCVLGTLTSEPTADLQIATMRVSKRTQE